MLHATAPTIGTPREPDSGHALSRRARHASRSPLRELVALTSDPEVLSLSGGLPATDAIPRRALREALGRALAEPAALQYGAQNADLEDRIVELMAGRGVTCCRDEVLVTTGAQQALHIAARLFVDPGTCVAAEEFTYTGFYQALEPLRAEILGLPSLPGRGLDVAALESHLSAGGRPALLYLVADHGNPTGACLPLAARRRIADLAARFGVPVIEDDPYGFLRFEGPRLPPLRSFAGDRVLYVGSFSKTLSPALRLGWLILPRELRPQAAVIKEAIDLESSALMQRAVACLLHVFDLERHLEGAREIYRQRRDAMAEALEKHLGDRVSWHAPTGGLFFWLRLEDERADSERLLAAAIRDARVAFVPGSAFSRPGSRGRRHLRLSFSLASPSQIRDGICRLSRILRGASP
ncbi:MAG: PLP-dependent aminotransferase family protein [Thermoanaerobaculia bacterium]|nr:PLP-dependent aminotransferase family protein [Thermoanaerobaculia bacterium]